MPSNYPSALDAFTNPTSTDDLDTPGVEHDVQHANANDAIEAIQATLGTDPQGVAATVAARIAAVESAGGGASALNDLTDVDTATVPPSTGQALVWDGTQWEPGTVSGGGAAPGTMVYEDTWQSATSYQIGDVVRYNGRLWLAVVDSVAAAPIEGGAPAFTEDFSDGVPFTSPWVLTNTPDISVIADFTGFSPPPSTVTQALQLGGDDTETTEAQLTLSFRIPGTISFTDTVDSEAGYDFGRFFIDGVEQYSIAGSDYAWTTREFNISAGEHIFAWRYNKDTSQSQGQDAYLVANIATTGTDDPGAWTPLAVGSALDDLTDVDTTTVAPAPGDVLTFDGTRWEPTQPSTSPSPTSAPLTLTGTAQISGMSGVATSGSAFAFKGELITPLQPISLTAIQARLTTTVGETYKAVVITVSAGAVQAIVAQSQGVVAATATDGVMTFPISADLQADVEYGILIGRSDGSDTFATGLLSAVESARASCFWAGAPTAPLSPTSIRIADAAPGVGSTVDMPTSVVPFVLGFTYATRARTRKTFSFSAAGDLAVDTGTHRLYNDTGGPLTITAVRASVGTPPVGSPLIVDVNKDGTTIFTTQTNRPTVPDGGSTDLADAVEVTSWAAGEYLTVDIDQVGSTTVGADLTVTIVAEG